MLTRLALPLLAITVLTTACATEPEEVQASRTTQAPSSSGNLIVTPTSVSPEEARYRSWKTAYEPYSKKNMNERDFRRAYEYQASACEVLRAGGTEPNERYPARSPAQYLRQDWEVGNAKMASSDKAEVLEKVVVPTLCPEQSQAVADALSGNFEEQLPISIGNGKFLVGTDVQPGTYTITEPVEDCYWERSDSQGNIIANNFISIAPSVTVTISPSDAGFTSQGCGLWKLQ